MVNFQNLDAHHHVSGKTTCNRKIAKRSIFRIYQKTFQGRKQCDFSVTQRLRTFKLLPPQSYKLSNLKSANQYSQSSHRMSLSPLASFTNIRKLAVFTVESQNFSKIVTHHGKSDVSSSTAQTEMNLLHVRAAGVTKIRTGQMEAERKVSKNNKKKC